MYGGFGAMIFAALLGGTGRVALPGALLLIAALVVAVFSAPAFYPRSSRYARDVLRGAAGMLAAQGTLLLATSEWPYGMGLLALLAGAWIAFHRMDQQRPHEADACGGCAEHGCDGVCSGFTHQAACLRGYEEEATAWLERHYARPGSGSTHT